MVKARQIRSIDGITRPAKKRSLLQRIVRTCKRSRPLQVFGVVIVVGVMVAAGIGISSIVSTPNFDDVETVENALSKHVLLPDEQPILATVTDKTALKTPFLKESQNGDRIVIYPKAKRVIIYRPTIDRVVNIGPVDINNIPGANSQQ